MMDHQLSILKKSALAAAFFADAFGIAPAQSTPDALQTLRQIKTVFVMALENHDWTQPCPDCSPQQILGNPAAPYLNSLATPGNSNAVQVSYATACYSVAPGEHSSEPNYIWAEAGTDFGFSRTTIPAPIGATCLARPIISAAS